MEFYFLLICWVRLFTDLDLPDTDNIVPFEYTTPSNQNKRQNKRFITLVEVIFHILVVRQK